MVEGFRFKEYRVFKGLYRRILALLWVQMGLHRKERIMHFLSWALGFRVFGFRGLGPGALFRC